MQNIISIDSIPRSLRTLYLLQNAVINYSGGANELLKQTQQRAEQLKQEDTVTSKLLEEISVYLKDISALAEQ